MNCSLQEHKKEGCKDYENKCDKDDEKTINIKKMTLKQALAVAVRREKQDRTWNRLYRSVHVFIQRTCSLLWIV